MATTDHYVFVSHPWLSLHHFLYQWTKAERGDVQRYSVAERDSAYRQIAQALAPISGN